MGLEINPDQVVSEQVSLESQRLRDVINSTTVTTGQIVSLIKSTAIVYESYLKSRSKRHFGAQTKQPGTYLQELNQTQKLMNQIREVLTNALSESKELPLGSRAALTRLNEYLSYLMVDYLTGFQKDLSQYKADSSYVQTKAALQGIVRAELELRRTFGLHFEPNTSSEQRAEYLYKIGLLKKYFQRQLFISVKTSHVAKKIFQPIAALAAALAALWAGLIQQAQTDSSVVSRLGLTPMWILTIGVIAYIIKDRIKEIFRHFLAGHVERILPDVEKKLVYTNENEKSIEIGCIREFVRGRTPSALPKDVYNARYSGAHSVLEAELGEDIIHYKKRIQLNRKIKTEGESWGLREILRINLNHYFQNLDDPFKEISFIDDEGRLGRTETHRIYYAHLALVVSYCYEGVMFEEIKLAQLILDKHGLVKAVDVGEDEAKTPTYQTAQPELGL